MSRPVIRRLTAEDLDAFIAVRIRQLREEGAKEQIDLTGALRQYYEKHMADGTFFSWIALDGGEIVGTSGMSVVEKPPYFGCPTGKIGLLSGMFTHPAYRRQGKGAALPCGRGCEERGLRHGADHGIGYGREALYGIRLCA